MSNDTKGGVFKSVRDRISWYFPVLTAVCVTLVQAHYHVFVCLMLTGLTMYLYVCVCEAFACTLIDDGFGDGSRN